MSLTPGTRLGPYEIVAPLGAGGMGEVYRAKDTRLGRDVAVKVLPQHLSSSPEIRARFEREAKTVSSLNHPSICTLHDVGREGDTDYLVMELIEGETLAQRLVKGPLPLADVLKFGGQIADALDRAHRAGVMHRDLKPGNVMLTKSGAKLMDFGLARATGLGAVSEMTSSPTVVGPLTTEGTILGTFQYMAPEQLEGQEADTRADLWALGCVLYEMATAKRAFDGKSQASLITAIMGSHPAPISQVSPLAPAALDRLVQACLAKDAAERIQSAHDVKLQLSWIADGGSQPGAQAPVIAPSRGRGRERLAWALAVVGVASALGLGALLIMKRPPSATPIHAAIPPPPGGTIVNNTSTPVPLAIAPDGSHMVFCARVGEGPIRLFVRSLAADDTRPLAGTENAEHPFFSPDGRSIGFFVDGKLKRVEVSGGPVTTLCEAFDSRGGTWSPRGVILFTGAAEGGVSRVAAEGGAVTPATTLDKTLNESTHRYPSFLPDGVHFLYLARRSGAGRGIEPTIYVGSLDSPDRARVLGVASNVVYASGSLLFVQQGVLVAQPFDPGKLTTRGPAVPLAENVRMDERFSRGAFAASQNGMLVYLTGKAESRTQLRWLDRRGATLSSVGEAADFTYGGIPEISPDGRRAVMAILNPERGDSAVWVVDLDSGRRRRLTLDDGDHTAAVWSADGARVVYTGSNEDVLARAADGSGNVETLYPSRPDRGGWPRACSPDGKWFLDAMGQKTGGADIVAIPMSRSGEPVPVAATPAHEEDPQFSPDGRFVAYKSAESGRDEVYVAAFPPTGAKWQVSQEGGVEPRFSRDGKELFYFDRENRLTAVEIKTSGSAFETGASKVLFQFHGAGPYRRYDVAPDGKSFLVTTELEEKATPLITLVANWTATIKP
jgi:serine/threonine protein kinase